MQNGSEKSKRNSQSIAGMAKEEASKKRPETQCCASAFLSALMHTAGTILIRNRKLSVMILSENVRIQDSLDDVLGMLYGQTCQPSPKGAYLRGDYVMDMLSDCGIIRSGETVDLVEGIDRYLVSNRCCKAAYVRGAFLGAGSLSAGENGYHMEFALSNMQFAKDLCVLLEETGIRSRIAKRKEKYIVYIKDNENISDCLALIGAGKAVIRINDLYVKRQVRQQSNRRTNCDLANMDRTIDAAMRQIEAIRKILPGLEEGKLKETAEARLAHPDATYEQLAQILAISKSGLKHRLKKLEAFGDPQ